MKDEKYEDSAIRQNYFLAHFDVFLVCILLLDVITKFSALMKEHDFSFFFILYFCILLVGIKILHLFFSHNKFFLSYYVPFERHTEKYFTYLFFSLLKSYSYLSLAFITFFILNVVWISIFIFYYDVATVFLTFEFFASLFVLLFQCGRYGRCKRLVMIKILQKDLKRKNIL